MWLSGQGLIAILLSDSFRIELRYYISAALEAFARLCLWGRVKLHFPRICGHKGLWPLSAAASLPCALKGGCGTASCSPARRVLQEKKYLEDLGSSPQNWGIKIESRAGLGRILDSRLFLGDVNCKELLFLSQLVESQLAGRETPEQERRFWGKACENSCFPQCCRERGEGNHPPRRPQLTHSSRFSMCCYS